MAARLRKEFGLSLSDRDALADAQNAECLICGERETDLRQRLAVDHDHATGLIHGLLCSNCNSGLGRFHDNPDLLRAAADYLEQRRQAVRESA